jgi:regulator of RNase E activity RraA
MGFPIWAKGVQPQDSIDRWGITEFLKPIVIGNIFIRPDDYIFADEDAVLVIKSYLVKDVVGKLPTKLNYEQDIRNEIKYSDKTAGHIYDTRGRW